VNTTGSTAGQALTFLVLRKVTDTSYSVVATDARTLPTPLPPSGVASFTLTTPITVAAGDTLGLYSTTTATCYFSGGSTSTADSLFALTPSGTPTPGQTLTMPGPTSPAGYTMAMSAEFDGTMDAAVSASAGPAGAVAGGLAQLSALVTNGGPGSSPITFTDTVPAGLTIASAIAGLGTCSTSGQNVTCTISNLAPGQSAPVAITVVPKSSGTYPNSVAVSGAPLTDPNPANNAASTSLVVKAGPRDATKVCIVPPLARTPLAAARRVLRGLHCRVGKVKRAPSRKVHRGDVISASPSRGVHKAGTRVKLKVSSGPPRKGRRGKH